MNLYHSSRKSSYLSPQQLTKHNFKNPRLRKRNFPIDLDMQYGSPGPVLRTKF